MMATDGFCVRTVCMFTATSEERKQPAMRKDFTVLYTYHPISLAKNKFDNHMAAAQI